MQDFSDYAHHIARALGALLGVIASMLMVAPEGTRNAFARLWIGATMGFIFAPVAPGIPGLGFLRGETIDFAIARGAAVAFVVWFVLEIIVRMLSKNDWIVKLLQEILRNRTGGGA